MYFYLLKSIESKKSLICLVDSRLVCRIGPGENLLLGLGAGGAVRDVARVPALEGVGVRGGSNCSTYVLIFFFIRRIVYLTNGYISELKIMRRGLATPPS